MKIHICTRDVLLSLAQSTNYYHWLSPQITDTPVGQSETNMDFNYSNGRKGKQRAQRM